MKKTKIKKILFYTSVPRLFRTTLIGYLYEISQDYPVILLSEELDSETEEILINKELFPKLEKIIPVRQQTGQKMNLLAKNKYLYKLAKEIIQHYEPDVVIAENDMYAFELYLMRFAKKIKAINVCFQGAFQPAEVEQISLRANLMSAYLRTPTFLSLRGNKLLFAKCRKYLRHFIYYWIMPLMVGQLPFIGKSSCILWKGTSGLRDAHYSVVFSKRDYDLSIQDGAPVEKLYILSHPLRRKTPRKFFEETYFLNSPNKSKINTKILTLMFPPEPIGFKQDDHSLISKEEMQKNRIKIITLVTKILKGWKVFIKPHPMVEDITEIKKTFESISKYVKVTKSSEPADRYIEMSDVIVGIPPSDTSVFTASFQCPQKIILSLDLPNELLGDSYKKFGGIEYVDSEDKFINILELIQNNKYHKKYKGESESNGFSSTVELLEYLFHKKENENY